MNRRALVLPLAILLLVAAPSARPRAFAIDQQSEAHKPQESQSIGAELAQETNEPEEENGNLKYSSTVRALAHMTGMSKHQAYWVSKFFNFFLIAFLIYWFGRKTFPAAFRNRGETIRKALEEARAASQEANRRLAEVENRLRKLDVEIGQMQAAAEKEGEAEASRIQKATEEEMRKIVQSAQQEITAAEKQARRELTAYTADLAVALASKQIRIDPAADEALLRNFAGQLSRNGGKGGK